MCHFLKWRWCLFLADCWSNDAMTWDLNEVCRTADAWLRTAATLHGNAWADLVFWKFKTFQVRYDEGAHISVTFPTRGLSFHLSAFPPQRVGSSSQNGTGLGGHLHFVVTGLGCVVGLATLGHLALSPSLELSSAQGNMGTLESLSFTLCIYTNRNLKARFFQMIQLLLVKGWLGSGNFS